MPSPILARADALMHRKRQTDGELDDVPILTDSIDEEDDIPVLTEEAAPAIEETAISYASPHREVDLVETEAVTTEEAPRISNDAPASLADAMLQPTPSDTELREQLACELARRVEQRLATELPRIIESTLRDFLAEQAMIAASPHHD